MFWSEECIFGQSIGVATKYIGKYLTLYWLKIKSREFPDTGVVTETISIK